MRLRNTPFGCVFLFRQHTTRTTTPETRNDSTTARLLRSARAAIAPAYTTGCHAGCEVRACHFAPARKKLVYAASRPSRLEPAGAATFSPPRAAVAPALPQAQHRAVTPSAPCAAAFTSLRLFLWFTSLAGWLPFSLARVFLALLVSGVSRLVSQGNADETPDESHQTA